MTKLIDRAIILMSATVTYTVAVAVGLTAAAGEIAEVGPEGGEGVVAWIVRGVAWLTSAAAIVRNVTPVPEANRGILPPDNGDWSR